MEALFLLYSLDLLNPDLPHRASYDDDGNIILPARPRAGSDGPQLRQSSESNDVDSGPAPRPRDGFFERMRSTPEMNSSSIVEWIVVEDEPESLHKLEAMDSGSPISAPHEPMRLHVRERTHVDFLPSRLV